MIKMVMKALSQMDRPAIEVVLAEMVMLAGMTPLMQLQLPARDEVGSWAECWERGLERVDRLGREALDRERETM
jgi:hypothetical protein